jgi:hypothetical protein
VRSSYIGELIEITQKDEKKTYENCGKIYS